MMPVAELQSISQGTDIIFLSINVYYMYPNSIALTSRYYEGEHLSQFKVKTKLHKILLENRVHDIFL